MSAQQIVDGQWGMVVPTMPNAFNQVTDVVANAYSVLKTIPALLTRWSQMRNAFDSFLMTRRQGALDPYYQIVKESQLAALLIMHPAATQLELFDWAVGVENVRPPTMAELQQQAQDSEQLRAAELNKSAAGFVPPGA